MAAETPGHQQPAKPLTRQQALSLWRLALTEGVRSKDPDLSSRQMAIMLAVYLTPPPHTVRGLAAALKISKPAVSRALDALAKLAFLRRKPDPSDKRSVIVERTVKGSVYLTDFADAVIRAWRALDEA
jgi:DNA-binding MarR family transcriptional regulator